MREKEEVRKEAGKEEEEDGAKCSVPVRAMLPGDHSVNHLEVSSLDRHALGSPDRPTPHLPFPVDFYNFMELALVARRVRGSDS